MAPFALDSIIGKTGLNLVYVLIGMAFGASLEISGFSDSRRLAGQFYLKDMTVIQVMFTAIVVAMVLIFGASALGILDYSRIWVNPTYLVPELVGGFILGLGFVIGGFCPGTSIVAMGSLKIDAVFFFLGVSTGIFIFGETVSRLGSFFYTTAMGRFTIPEWLGVDAGIVVVFFVLLAVFLFWGAEKLEPKYRKTPRWTGNPQVKRAGALALVLAAVGVAVIGQPTLADRWKRVAPEKEQLLQDRKVQIEPMELLALTRNKQIRLVALDVRTDRDYNLYHLIDAKRVSLDEIKDGVVGLGLLNAPSNTVVVLMSNGEGPATEAWKYLVAQGVPNVYILGGGLNAWIERFCGKCEPGEELPPSTPGDDPLHYRFNEALGANQPASNPDLLHVEKIEYTPKVKLQKRKKLSGGCG